MWEEDHFSLAFFGALLGGSGVCLGSRAREAPLVISLPSFFSRQISSLQKEVLEKESLREEQALQHQAEIRQVEAWSAREAEMEQVGWKSIRSAEVAPSWREQLQKTSSGSERISTKPERGALSNRVKFNGEKSEV